MESNDYKEIIGLDTSKNNGAHGLQPMKELSMGITQFPIKDLCTLSCK